MWADPKETKPSSRTPIRDLVFNKINILEILNQVQDEAF